MKQTTHTLTGKIINKNTQQPIGDLRIEAWDNKVKDSRLLARTDSVKEGKFTIEIDTAGLTIKKSEIIFKIYRGDEMMLTVPLTEVSKGNKTGGIIIPLNIPSLGNPDPQEPDLPENQWRVMGHVRKANGDPIEALVSATNVKLNNQQSLGQVQTNKGAYIINYNPETNLPGCNLPDLLVEATINDKVIASSSIIYNAEKVTTVDLVVGNETYKGPSEYQQLEQTIKPCVGDQDPATLTAENVEYLSNKAGANQQWLTLYVLSHRQNKVTNGAAPLFYGCFRKQLPRSLDKLITLKPQVIKARIQSAIDDNIIDDAWKDTINDFIASLQSAAIKSALVIDKDSTETSLGKVFTQVKIPSQSQEPFLNLYVKHQDDIPTFWKTLRENSLLKQYEAPLKLGLKVSALTQHFEPATKVIMEHPVFANASDISKLTQLSTDDWIQITKSIGTAPENVPGEGDEQLKNYATLMEKSIISAFPTQHVAANVAKSDQYKNTELPKFFEAARDFSFEGTNISSYVNKLNGAIKDNAAVIKDLSKLQRLFYLSPEHSRYTVMDTLDKAGMGSALQITQYGKNAFLNVFGKKLNSKSLASEVFNKASSVSATTMNLALQYNDLGSNILPYVLQGKKGKNKKPGELDLPDLSSLFGAQSFCSCKHCRSVYSAAAYFVDLLSYLKEHYEIDTVASTDTETVYVEKSPDEFVNGLDLLFARRSDLGDILLNCENTNTVIPYLDIVNEVLENAVLSTPEAYQTTSTSDELKANPEHIKTTVYDDYLAKEVFPFSQPFNLWNEEGNVYMEHLEISRYEMMDAFQFHGNANEPDDQSKYAVQLDLTTNGKEIITGKTVIDSTTYSTAAFWGAVGSQWIERLSKVQKFIDNAEISYEQLLEFLQLKFVNATGTVKIQFAPDAPCDIGQALLAYWDEATQSFSTDPIQEKFFIRAHCFFRLLQKTPWSIFELGRIMGSLSVQNISEKFIGQAAILLQLQKRFKKEPLELLSWWTDLNTQHDQNNPDDRSFYARHFLNKTVFDPQEINADTFVFNLNEDGTELKNTGNLISERLNEIEAALNIGSSDLLLLTPTPLNSSNEIDDALTLKNLSQLFRIVSLTKALRISVTEYLIAIDYIIPDPFNADKATDLISFIEQVDQVKRSGFNFTELQYLLLDQYNSADGIAPTEERIISLFTGLQDGLMKIKTQLEVPLDANGTPVDPTGELCKQKLSMLIEEEGIGWMVSMVEASGPLSPEQQVDAALYLYFIDVDQLIIDFAGNAYKTIEARYAYILKGLVSYLTATQSRSFIIQTFSTDLSISLDTTELLLTQLVYSTASAHDPNNPVFANEDFLVQAFAYDVLEEGESFDLLQFSIQQNTYVALYKSALFINKFNLNAEDVSWTFTNGSAIGWLDLNVISGAAPDVFLKWGKMENFFYMRKQFNEGDTTFFELMDYAAEPSLIENLETGYEDGVDAFIASSSVWTDADKNFLIFLSLLSEITGWETDSLFFLASSEAYISGFNDFKDEQAFYQLMQCFDVLNTLGSSANDAWNWMAVDLTSEKSGNIKQTAKAKYSETEWLKVAAPLRDVLREKQRDALTAYLIQNRDFDDENALYEYYLLDVETSACTMSFRIVLANSSVQLFIQRHLMNLEAELLDLDTGRWEWMKNYRVWEANRKVFLYPENWIEPELRLIKSEFFTDLQNALLQNDVTADLVETSIKDYLEKLDEISNIEVCGMYHEYEEGDGITTDTIDVLHVFGKTSGVPNEYYYRTYVDNNYWTPWEKANLDIQGNVIPIVINRRLHLFWLEMIETQRDDDPFVDYVWQIKLAYSEYKNGKWLAKKVTQELLESPGFSYSNTPFRFFFVTEKFDTYFKLRFKWVITSNGEYEGSFQFYYDTKKIIINEMVVIYPNDLLGIKPANTNVDSMVYIEEENNNILELPAAQVDADNNYNGNEYYTKVLDATPGIFRIPIPHQYEVFVSQDNFFYGDDYRNFFVKPYNAFYTYNDYSLPTYSTEDTTFYLNDYLNETDIAVGIFHETSYNTHGVEGAIVDTSPKDEIDPLRSPIIDVNAANQQVDHFQYLGSINYRFYNFYHPYINDFIKAVNVGGVEELLTREMQLENHKFFSKAYLPTESVHEDYPIKEVDFSPEGAMSFYNWELFFHIPMLIAGRLSQNQQFEDAQKWYHFIFNPLDRSSEVSPNKFWQFKPFFELYGNGEGAAEDSIYNLLYALSYTGNDSEQLDKKAEVEQQVAAWLASPFDPHAIAALRPVAYMKSIVMKYIDNLVAWGDYKFQQDTIESINEATQVYILAAQILGKRPELIPVKETEERSYNQLIEEVGTLDSFSNALVTMENFYNSETLTVSTSAEAELLPKSLYFCIPNNPNLLAYWDKVEDRLFKIRHCMNIEGVVRQLPLFQPPIDPALLVKARAGGLSIGSVLNDLYAPLPHYRYRVMVQKALELCADVKALGNALLTILEKKDAEEMALLRAGHELKLLQVMKDVKKLQLDEARENLSGLKTTRKITETRYDYYVKIEKINNKEQLNLNKLKESRDEQKLAEKNEKRAAFAYQIPNVTLGLSSGSTFGGSNLGAMASAYAAGHRNKSADFAYEANMASINAGYNRRWDDWKLQEKLASRELDNIDKQIMAAEIRVAIMEKEIDNHNLQSDQSREVNDYMVNKFTNKELFDWMSGQLSTVYFQSYQMAYDLAKRAQKTFQYELGSDQTFIQFGYWDSLKKGLLAGDKLHYDIRRMDIAWLDQSKRTYELTKSISLVMLDPMALVQLRETGTCYINLPEALYDLDYAGHYMRRVKSVQLTMPCVTGPFTSVSCKLTLLDNKWRKDSSGDDYAESTEVPDSRFVYNTGGTQSIATSSGQNDSGMFQLNFNDERFLPFEGAGAVSNWRLELPAEMRSFDYNTLSDVIVQINYTAKDGGDILKGKVNTTLQEALMDMALGSDNKGLTRMFSMKNEFSNEWYRFLNPPVEQDGQQITIGLDSTRFPYLFRKFDITVSVAEIILILDDSDSAGEIPINITAPGLSTIEVELMASAGIGGQLYGMLESISANTGDWQITIDEATIPASLKITEGNHVRLNTDVVKNMIVILSYGISGEA